MHFVYHLTGVLKATFLFKLKMIIVQNHTQLTRTHDITYSEERSRQTLLSIVL